MFSCARSGYRRLYEHANERRLSLGAGREAQAFSATVPVARADSGATEYRDLVGAGSGDRRCHPLGKPRRCRNWYPAQHTTGCIRRGAGSVAVALGGGEESAARNTALRSPTLPDNQVRQRDAAALNLRELGPVCGRPADLIPYLTPLSRRCQGGRAQPPRQTLVLRHAGG
jgi:hypothetical protein